MLKLGGVETSCSQSMRKFEVLGMLFQAAIANRSKAGYKVSSKSTSKLGWELPQLMKA